MSTVYPFEVTTATGETIGMEVFAGQVLLVVNVASKCGFTPQYAGLESLFQEFGPEGFTVLGFPCNQFANQEPGSNEEIQSFCQLTYNVTFPVFAKVEVNGGKAHPLFDYLTNALPGLLGIRSVKWNFTKFLVNRKGEPVARYAPTTSPEHLRDDIRNLLEEPVPQAAASGDRKW